MCRKPCAPLLPRIGRTGQDSIEAQATTCGLARTGPGLLPGERSSPCMAASESRSYGQETESLKDPPSSKGKGKGSAWAAGPRNQPIPHAGQSCVPFLPRLPSDDLILPRPHATAVQISQPGEFCG